MLYLLLSKLSFTSCNFLSYFKKNLNWYFQGIASSIHRDVSDWCHSPLFLFPLFFRVKMAKVPCTWQLSMEGSHDHKPSFRMVREILSQYGYWNSFLVWVWTWMMMLCFRVYWAQTEIVSFGILCQKLYIRQIISIQLRSENIKPLSFTVNSPSVIDMGVLKLDLIHILIYTQEPALFTLKLIKIVSYIF